MPSPAQMPNHQPHLASYFELVRAHAQRAGVFGEVSLASETGGVSLRCAAKASAHPAWYTLLEEQGQLWVALQTPARYLSQSIEADLMFTGDKIDELVHEELVDLGYSGGALRVDHFRDEAKLYTFRSPVGPAPTGAGASHLAPHLAPEAAVRFLLAYEAAFRPLGDMEADED